MIMSVSPLPQIKVPRRVSLRLNKNGITAPFQPRLLAIDHIQRDTMELNNPPEIMLVVGNTKIPVHEHLLVRNSPVFAQMLEMSLTSSRRIQIDNAYPQDFELVMKGLYEGVGIMVKCPPLQVLRCFEIAHNYNIRSLELGLHNIILKELNASNVFEVLSSPIVELGIVSEIASKCWSIIERKTLQAIHTRGFLTLSRNNFNKLLMNSRLTLPEYELAKMAVEWCKNQRENGRTLVEILGISIYQIRFPVMTRGEFNLICKVGILHRREIEDLKANFRNNKTYKTNPRKNKCYCQANKRKCVLCSVKWTQASQRFAEMFTIHDKNTSITTTDFNSNVISTKKGTASSVLKKKAAALTTTTTAPPCECQQYMSCPNFPNGQTIKIMRLKNIGIFKLSH